eukprot:8555814-Pyramimonas_sp.AAC.1
MRAVARSRQRPEGTAPPPLPTATGESGAGLTARCEAWQCMSTLLGLGRGGAANGEHSTLKYCRKSRCVRLRHRVP